MWNISKEKRKEYDRNRREEEKEAKKIPFHVEQEIARYEAYQETKGKEGKHKYCNHCCGCYKHLDCLLRKDQRYKGFCLLAKNRYLLKRSGYYGTETNRPSGKYQAY